MWLALLANPERRGVFAALYGHIQALASDDAGVCGIRLYVERDNHHRTRTYQKMSMIETGYQAMEIDFSRGAPIHA